LQLQTTFSQNLKSGTYLVLMLNPSIDARIRYQTKPVPDLCNRQVRNWSHIFSVNLWHWLFMAHSIH